MADYDPDRLMTERPTGTPMMTVRPKRAGPRGDDDDKGEGSALSPTMRQILEHIAGPESGGRYNIIYGGHTFDTSKGHPRIAVPIKEGPNAGKTSSAAGRYQFIGSTWDKVAQKTGRTDMSKESQDINAAQLAKDTYKRQTGRDIEADWSAGGENLRKGIDRALGAEWEAFAKAGPRMDKLDADGKPRYRFSDYAMQEHDGRSNTDLLMMSPQQYLDLSPELEGKPFASPSGRALKKSFDRGDAIEAVPTLDVNVDGPTATVTDQDGRHRALLAQQEGIDAIPVAVRKSGEGEPKEIVGMNGVPMAHDFPKASEVKGRQPQQQTQEQPKAPLSLFGRIGEAIIPSAEAAEADPWAQYRKPADQAQQPPAAAQPDDPWAQFRGGAQPPPPRATLPEPVLADPNASELAAVKGLASGLGKSVLAGGQIIGKGMQAVGIPGGETVANLAGGGISTLNQAMTPVEKEHPTAAGIGSLAGGMVIPGGVGAKIGGNALRAAVMGGVGGALEPAGENFWTDKLLQMGIGTGLSVVGNALMQKVADGFRSRVLPFYHFVEKVTGKDASKSPGALAVIKRMEMDAKAGGPTAQDMIDLANATPEKALTIADLGGPEIMGLTGRVARAPGPGRAAITNFLNDRDVGAGARLAADVDQGIGTGSSYHMANTLKKSRAAAAKPAYDAAYARYPINPDAMAPNGAIGSMLDRPAVRGGMANARKIAAEEGVDMQTLGIDLDAQGEPRFARVPTWKTLDYVKRGIDDVVEKFRDPTTGRLVLDTYGHAADATRTEYRNALRQLNPEYGAALDSYSGPSTSLDALHAGEDFLKQRPEEIAHRIANFGVGDREFYKMGAADTLRTNLEKKAASADEAKALINTQYMRRQLRPLFDNDAAYDRFIASVQAEARMFGTRFNALGGSQTAARRAEDTSPELEAMVHAARGALHAKAGNPIAAGANALRAFTALRAMRDPTTNAEIADILKMPLAGADTAKRLSDFKNFMTMLPMTRKAIMGNALADMSRGAGPAMGLGAGSLGAGLMSPNVPGEQ